MFFFLDGFLVVFCLFVMTFNDLIAPSENVITFSVTWLDIFVMVLIIIINIVSIKSIQLQPLAALLRRPTYSRLWSQNCLKE